MVLGKMNENKSIEEFVLVSKAPVETAAKLSKHFRILATKEKERARDILLAGEFARSFHSVSISLPWYATAGLTSTIRF